MLKKGLIAGAILALTSSVAFANGGSFVPPPPPCSEYFALGVDGSWDMIKYRTQSSFFLFNNINVLAPVLALPSIASNVDFDWGSNKVGADVFFDWGLVFHDLYTLGFEGFAGLSSSQTNINFASVTNIEGSTFGGVFPAVSITMKHYFGFGILPGVKLSPSTTLYGRMGLVEARFGLTDPTGFFGASIAISDPFGMLTTPFQVNFRTNKFGAQIGIGMTTVIPGHHIGIRGEYNWTKFNSIDRREGTGVSSITVPGVGPIPLPPEAVTVNKVQKIQPTWSQIKIGLYWVF